MRSNPHPPAPPAPNEATLPVPVFPQRPDLLEDPGPETAPEVRSWSAGEIRRKMRGWLYPYIRSRVFPGHFHPITAYLIVEYKCNVDCWYCWSFDNKVKGMTENMARRSIDCAITDARVIKWLWQQAKNGFRGGARSFED